MTCVVPKVLVHVTSYKQSASTEGVKSNRVRSPSVATVQTLRLQERWYISGSQVKADHVVEGGMAWQSAGVTVAG